MIATNKIKSLQIVFPEGEEDFTQHINLPLSYEPVLDETLNTAKIVISDLRQNEFKHNIKKAFHPFTLVKIAFEEQETKIRMVVARDQAKRSRCDEKGFDSWTHSVELVEEIKILERLKADTLTFTNPLPRKYSIDGTATWETTQCQNIYYADGLIPGRPKDVSEEKAFHGMVVPELKQVYGKMTLILNLSHDWFVPGSGGAESIKSLKLTITQPTGTTITVDVYSDSSLKNENYQYSLVLNQEGEYKFSFYFRWRIDHYSGNHASADEYEVTRETYIYVDDDILGIDIQISPYTLKDVIDRVLSVTPTHRKKDKKRFKFDASNLENWETKEAPEFAFDGKTLFEVFNTIGSYESGGMWPELNNDTIGYRKLWNGVKLTEEELLQKCDGECIDFYTMNNIDQYCSDLDSDIENLVGINDSQVGAIVEPYAEGYKTTRAVSGSEISEDTADRKSVV